MTVCASSCSSKQMKTGVHHLEWKLTIMSQSMNVIMIMSHLVFKYSNGDKMWTWLQKNSHSWAHGQDWLKVSSPPHHNFKSQKFPQIHYTWENGWSSNSKHTLHFQHNSSRETFTVSVMPISPDSQLLSITFFILIIPHCGPTPLLMKIDLYVGK